MPSRADAFVATSTWPSAKLSPPGDNGASHSLRACTGEDPDEERERVERYGDPPASCTRAPAVFERGMADGERSLPGDALLRGVRFPDEWLIVWQEVGVS